MLRRGISRKYAKGEFRFHAGDPARGLYLVLEGRVRIVNERNGRRHLVHEEGPGATLGEIPLLLGGGYPASAIAATATRCLLLSKDALLATLTTSPDFAWFLLMQLAQRVRGLVSRLEQASATPVRQALAALILERSGGSGAVTFGATQQELAETLGTVREVVARQLTALRRAGAIRSTGRGRIAVADREALTAIARLVPE